MPTFMALATSTPHKTPMARPITEIVEDQSRIAAKYRCGARPALSALRFRGPLGHGHQHDVHDDDAADHQRYGSDRDHDRKKGAADVFQSDRKESLVSIAKSSGLAYAR